MLWDVSLRVDSKPESLRVARRLVHYLALMGGASEPEASEIELSAGEALSNAHRYAYPDSVGPVGVEVQSIGATFSITVHDDGKAVTPPAIPNQLPGDSAGGGRGLFLISEIMDSVEIGIDAEGHGVILRMTRRVGGPTR